MKGDEKTMGKTLELVRKISKAEGEARILKLLQNLYALNRQDDAQRAIVDEKYREMLLKEFAIQ